MKEYQLPKLNYDYNELEPYIDGKTVEIHYSKHHQTYLNKLNQALASVNYDVPEEAEELIANLSKVPLKIRQCVRDNGGGYVNHNLYWNCICKKGEIKPNGALMALIEKSFSSFERCKEEFTKAGLTLLGSGWVWLYLDEDKNLKIGQTKNHDNPLMRGFSSIEGYPLMVMDVWEHAYYLKYQNKRAEYIESFFEIINWKYVEQRYSEYVK